MRSARWSLAALVLLLAAGPAGASSRLCGDANGDGVRDVADAERLARCDKDPSGCDADRWDTNLDGRVDGDDAARVLSCDGGSLRCQCRANTIRVIVLPDLQCLVDQYTYHCINRLLKQEFAFKKGDHASGKEFYAAWGELKATPEYEPAVQRYLDSKLDVLDATFQGLLELRPPPDLIMNAGDSVHLAHDPCEEIRADRLAHSREQWDLFMNNTRGRTGYAALLASEIPVATAQGNHDECGFEEHIPGRGPNRRADAVLFDAKGSTGLALARHWGSLPDSSRWLRKQLAGHEGGPVFYIGHDAVVRRADRDCLFLHRNQLGAKADRVAFATGGHFMTKGYACKEIEDGRLLSYANFQMNPMGGRGYLVEVRFWPVAEPAFPAGGFEVRTYSLWKGQSWDEPGHRQPQHEYAGRLDWSRFR